MTFSMLTAREELANHLNMAQLAPLSIPVVLHLLELSSDQEQIIQRPASLIPCVSLARRLALSVARLAPHSMPAALHLLALSADHEQIRERLSSLIFRVSLARRLVSSWISSVIEGEMEAEERSPEEKLLLSGLRQPDELLSLPSHQISFLPDPDLIEPVIQVPGELASGIFQALYRKHVTSFHHGDDVERDVQVAGGTLSRWIQRGHVRRADGRDHKMLEIDSLANVLVAALVDRRRQGFLPSQVGEDEPHWWAYALEDPKGEVRVLPVPLPENLGPQTLLWTPWPTYKPGWRHFPSVGAIRFAGIKCSKRGDWRWNVPLPALSKWSPSFALMLQGGVLRGGGGSYELHQYAEMVLLELARRYLFPSPLSRE